MTSGQLYETIWSARKEKDSNGADSEDSQTNDAERKKKAGVEVEGVLLHHRRDVGNVLSSSFSCRARHNTVYEVSVHVYRKGFLHGVVLSHVHYNRQNKIPTKYLWLQN